MVRFGFLQLFHLNLSIIHVDPLQVGLMGMQLIVTEVVGNKLPSCKQPWQHELMTTFIIAKIGRAK